MKSKGIALLTTCTLVFSSAVLTSCNEDEKVQAPSDELDDVILDMAETPSISEKILSVALEGLQSGIKGGVTKVVSSVGTWALNGIAKKMGLNYAKDEKHEEIMNKLNELDDKISNITTDIQAISDELKDQKYINQYNVFKANYDKYEEDITLRWKHFTDIEASIKEGIKNNSVDEDKVKLQVDKLCMDIANKNPDIDHQSMKDASHDLGLSFLAQPKYDTAVLNSYSLFHIVEKFVSKQNPYDELRYKEIYNVLADAYTLYYQACTLNLFERSYDLAKKNLVGYITDKDDKVIVYTMYDPTTKKETQFINCTEANKETFLKKLTDAGEKKEDYEGLTCQKVSDIPNSPLNPEIDYLETILKNYNKTTKLLTEFLSTTHFPNRGDEKRTITYESGDYKGKTQKTNTVVDVLKPRDFIDWDSKAKTFSLNYSKFGNISKKEFEAYANTIRKLSVTTDDNAKTVKLSFRDFLKKVGYKSTKDLTKVKYLVLGARTVKNKSFDSLYNNGFAYENAWQLMTVDIDTIVDSFCENPTYVPITYATYIRKERKDNGCAVDFKYINKVIESYTNMFDHNIHGKAKYSDDFKTWKGAEGMPNETTYYISIKGLSTSASTSPINPTKYASF